MPDFETLKNEEGGKVPGLISEQESMKHAQQEATGLLNTISRESVKMESASPEKLLEYIAYTQKRIDSDPRIKSYPGLDESYRNAQRKAMALLEDQGINMVTRKIMGAKKLAPAEKAKATENIINDLAYMQNYWQEKLQSKLPPATAEKLQKLMFDAKTLRDSQFNA